MFNFEKYTRLEQSIAKKLLDNPNTPIPYPSLHPDNPENDPLNAIESHIYRIKNENRFPFRIIRIQRVQDCSTRRDVNKGHATPCYALLLPGQVQDGEYFSLNWGDNYYPDIQIEDAELIDLVDFLHMVRIGDRAVETRIGGVTEQLFFKQLVARYPNPLRHKDFARIHEPNVRAGLSPAKLTAFQNISYGLEEYYCITGKRFYIERSDSRGSSWSLVKAIY